MERQHLVENFAHDWNEDKLPIHKFILQEEKLVEAEGKKYKVTEGYEVPIWRLDKKNLNGRTYSKPLGERVVNENKKTFSLKDHPDNEGSVDRIVAIAESPHIKKGILYANAFFVDEEFEKKIEKIIERGMGLGVSSSAYGDVDSDGNVLEEGFELERYFDFVLNPSYQVYLTKESIIKESNNNEDLKDNNTNIIINKVGEKETIMSEKDNKVLSIEEKNLKMGVKNLLKEAEKTEDLQEKLVAYKEVLDYCNDSPFAEDYVKEAQSKISEIENNLIKLAAKGKELEESNTSLEELNSKLSENEKSLKLVEEKYQKALELIEDYKEREEKIKQLYEITIAEKNGMVEASEYKEALVFIEEKEKEVETLKVENLKLKKRLHVIEKKALDKMNEEDKADDEEKKDDEEMKDDEKKEEKVKKVIKKKKQEMMDDMMDDELEPQLEEPMEDIMDYPEESPSVYDFGNAVEVETYYEDLYDRNPAVEKIKEQILKCKTVTEAQKTYLDLKDLIVGIRVPTKYSRIPVREKEDTKPSRKPTLHIRKGWD